MRAKTNSSGASAGAAAVPPRHCRRRGRRLPARGCASHAGRVGGGTVHRHLDDLQDAARVVARQAAGGVSGGTNVTCAMVQTTVQNYLQAAGFPSAAYSNAQVTLTNLSSDAWTDPWQAQPLDPFSVTVTIPAGAPFNSLIWVPSTITGVNQASATVQWFSNNDTTVTVSTQLPY